MNKLIESSKEWFLKRDTYEKIVLVLVSFLIMYSFWHALLVRPIKAEQEKLQNQISELQSLRKTVDNEYATMMKIVQSQEFSSLLTQEKQLSLKSKDVRQKIENFTPIFVSETDFPQLSKDILNQLDKTITLIRLQELPLQYWESQDINSSVTFMKNIYQHKIIIEFHANYFDALAFLSRLEKLSWHLYWDSLEYKVVKYPEANVVVQLYVLSQRTEA